ncbi:hypothetical protein [Candidatus Magnetobacterium casense]|uniref:Replication protein n=1 Tax=Candidatus Magnetobacterium casense TaxID=1455061 RepID=A0ABS6RXJ1_9BACT|nr:hypothetical protein [Candidatus Magnetobacterium casensis]MBV6340973.1 hypothetical protein [Candidatus Magnetobacterium casensis]
MKRGTPRHPKVACLASTLGITQYAAVGLLEMLWHFTAEFARDGGIGKYSDDVIKAALSYDGDSTTLINALASCGWIDRCDCHRLRIHDWKEHADQTVQKVLAKHNQTFAQCYDGDSIILSPSKMPSPSPSPSPIPSPIPKAQEKKPARARVEYDQDFNTFWSSYPRRIGKDAAWKAWKKARPPIDDVLRAIEWQKKTWADPQYIPHPSTYINQGRWKDDPETRQPIGKETAAQKMVREQREYLLKGIADEQQKNKAQVESAFAMLGGRHE